jgi:hypothetical protein
MTRNPCRSGRLDPHHLPLRPDQKLLPVWEGIVVYDTLGVESD